MFITIVICILAATIASDLLAIIIYNLCELFREDASKNKISGKKFFTGYINFSLQQWQKSRSKFLIYYALLNIATITATILMIVLYGVTLKAFAGILFAYCLIVLTFVDAKTQMLPDIVTKPLIALGVLQGYLGIFTDLRTSLIGALAGYFTLWTINTIFRFVRHKEGMGYGDFKLLSAIGAWGGYVQLPFVIFISSLIGVFIALGLARFAKNPLSAPSPFGPALAFSGFISLIWGAEIIDWYLGLFV